MVFQFGVFSSVFCVHTKCWTIGLKELLHTSISPPGSFSGSRLPTDGFIFGLSTVETWFSGRSPALSHVLYGFLPARTQHIMLCPNGSPFTKLPELLCFPLMLVYMLIFAFELYDGWFS
ncbi:hypothetical protein ES288_A05G384900v1 [Gossypium darwinii]|uniref:Uncharacterized protein n=2 Tax=Gossypium TaxID=3633 RepID=A0A5C7J255_GOSTO|nr:hypothetical protein ES332_1Z016100v1 [Gossypium tomentosum]TYH19854.1 hypothetical protein ES288_A05G384900v1 [Gossypium darwinii]